MIVYFLSFDQVFIGFAGEWDVRGATLTGIAPRVIRYINRAIERGARMIRELQFQGNNVITDETFVWFHYY